jgi:methylated-DNA-[protein]-cysteine S-methyltransferase
MSATYFTRIESPLGPLLLAADDVGLRRIEFANGRSASLPDPAWKEDSSPLEEVIRQLRAYFAGDLDSFDLLTVRPFPTANWPAVSAIPRLRAPSAWRMVLIPSLS